ncbi:MAG: UDP-glucose:undecaprenyl-phosphate glucose-1-phosphate transferase [Verrucomicrobia bacterium ADurb.Bin345]|nr:MAG: UDP-glucose:undecaprenyl-phosphate glucose-1-phosphate transferase [Verrucomicrobia bacterium ADurb.Bin345]
MCSVAAVIVDAVAVFTGFMLAVWIRFDSGWIPLPKGQPPRMMYLYAAVVVTILFLFIFRSLELYRRPQFGHVTDRIPRLVRACGMGTLLATALAFVIQSNPPFSRLTTGIAMLTVTGLVIIERNILFQLERHYAKHQATKKRVAILGTGELAARLKDGLEGEPRRRAKVVAFLRTNEESVSPAIPSGMLRGSVQDLPGLLEAGEVDEVILANPSNLTHERMVEMILQCERALVNFQMVPDMFGLLTSRVDLENVDEIPLLGMTRWPLDYFWNRIAKRIEDIAGAAVGLVISAPIIMMAALLIKRSSPGPVFYRQERCGERGRVFILFKLRTMLEDAEAETGPVWAKEEDPRRTRVGAFLRRHNLDELPQFWNVLKGDMSLVGPRPERPHFVEQFKEDISRYMWRHVYKPGITGWAQISGLRGNTDIRERIKYDLYYLENWSLAFDFKIMAKTFFSRENAY